MSEDNTQNPATPKLPRAHKDVQAANYAYNATSLKTKDGKYKELALGLINTKDLEIFQEAGIKFLGISDFILDEKDNGSEMRAVIFLDENTKEITISIAGTRVDMGLGKAYADLVSNINVARGEVTSKQSAVDKINEILIGDLKEAGIDNIKDYKFHYTGHSLGAVMADCAAADMTLRLKLKHGINVSENQISTVTFDNPGASTIVSTICKKYEREHPGTNINIDELKKTTSFKAINNRPNFINTVDEQVGEKFTMVPHDQKPLNSFSLMCQYVGQRFYNTPVLGYIIKVLSMGSPMSQIQDHSLNNFHNVIVTKEDEVKGHYRASNGRKMLLDEVITGIEPIKYEEQIFDKIKEIRGDDKEGKVKAKFSMLHPETQERIEFSKTQMEAAVKLMSKSEISTTKKPGWYEIFNSESKNIVNSLLKEAKSRAGKATGLPLSDNMPNEGTFMRTAKEALADGKGKER